MEELRKLRSHGGGEFAEAKGILNALCWDCSEELQHCLVGHYPRSIGCAILFYGKERGAVDVFYMPELVSGIFYW